MESSVFSIILFWRASDSLLLKKEIIELTMRPHEYTSMEKTCISLFCIDFAAIGRCFEQWSKWNVCRSYSESTVNARRPGSAACG